jgi:hypothetical protein
MGLVDYFREFLDNYSLRNKKKKCLNDIVTRAITKIETTMQKC